MRHLMIIFGVFILAAACTASLDENQLAQRALTDYFIALNKGDYAAAVARYGGSYELLKEWNPDIDPQEYAALFERGCTQNGLQCLALRTASLHQRSGDSFVFLVEFSNPDGSLFVRGPCCGASETEMPPVSQFSFTVVKAEDKFLVQELPVYVP